MARLLLQQGCRSIRLGRRSRFISQRQLWQMRQPLCQEHDQQWAEIWLPVNLDHVSHKSRSIFSYCNCMKGMSQETLLREALISV